MGMYAAHQATQFQGSAAALNQARADSEATLREKFGPQYDARLTQAKRVVQSLGGAGVIEALNATGAGNNPELIEMFAKIGAMMGEDQLKSGASGSFGMGRKKRKRKSASCKITRPTWTSTTRSTTTSSRRSASCIRLRLPKRHNNQALGLPVRHPARSSKPRCGRYPTARLTRLTQNIRTRTKSPG